MAQTVVTVVIAVVGVVAFVATVLCALVPAVVRLGDESPDNPPLLARSGRPRVPHSPAAVDTHPAPAEPARPVVAASSAVLDLDRTAA